MKQNKKRNFALRDIDGIEIANYVGKWPRQAALKATNDIDSMSADFGDKQEYGGTSGWTIIRLRERGTKRIHLFRGKSVKVPKPANAPSWLPEMINKAIVYKLRIDKT